MPSAIDVTAPRLRAAARPDARHVPARRRARGLHLAPAAGGAAPAHAAVGARVPDAISLTRARGRRRRPWLALVLIAEGEGSLLTDVAVAQCVTAGVTLADQRRDVPKATCLEVPESVVDDGLPDAGGPARCSPTSARSTSATPSWRWATTTAGWRSCWATGCRRPDTRYIACLINLEGQYAELPGRPAESQLEYDRSTSVVDVGESSTSRSGSTPAADAPSWDDHVRARTARVPIAGLARLGGAPRGGPLDGDSRRDGAPGATAAPRRGWRRCIATGTAAGGGRGDDRAPPRTSDVAGWLWPTASLDLPWTCSSARCASRCSPTGRSTARSAATSSTSPARQRAAARPRADRRRRRPTAIRCRRARPAGPAGPSRRRPGRCRWWPRPGTSRPRTTTPARRRGGGLVPRPARADARSSAPPRGPTARYAAGAPRRPAAPRRCPTGARISATPPRSRSAACSRSAGRASWPRSARWRQAARSAPPRRRAGDHLARRWRPSVLGDLFARRDPLATDDSTDRASCPGRRCPRIRGRPPASARRFVRGLLVRARRRIPTSWRPRGRSPTPASPCDEPASCRRAAATRRLAQRAGAAAADAARRRRRRGGRRPAVGRLPVQRRPPRDADGRRRGRAASALESMAGAARRGARASCARRPFGAEAAMSFSADRRSLPRNGDSAPLVDVHVASVEPVAGRRDAPDPGPRRVPRDLRIWLARLRLLEGVPFSYLVADSALLPPESIRFFYLDRGWTDALVEGALSRRHRHDRRPRGARGSSTPVVRDEVDEAERLVRLPGCGAGRGRADRAGRADHRLPAALAHGVGLAGAARARLRARQPAAHAAGERRRRRRRARRAARASSALLRLERLAPAVLLALFDGVPAGRARRGAARRRAVRRRRDRRSPAAARRAGRAAQRDHRRAARRPATRRTRAGAVPARRARRRPHGATLARRMTGVPETELGAALDAAEFAHADAAVPLPGGVRRPHPDRRPTPRSSTSTPFHAAHRLRRAADALRRGAD